MSDNLDDEIVSKCGRFRPAITRERARQLIADEQEGATLHARAGWAAYRYGIARQEAGANTAVNSLDLVVFSRAWQEMEVESLIETIQAQ